MERIVKRDYPYVISRHEVKNGEIIFFHLVPKYEKNEKTGLFDFVGKKEEEWNKLRIENKSDFTLQSNSFRFRGGGYTCCDSELMRYFRTIKGAKLIKSIEVPNYDEDPDGRPVQFGYNTYEEWDLSGLLK